MIDADIRQYLLSVDAVNDLATSQIFGVIRPQGIRPLPELLITRVGTSRSRTFCGTRDLVFGNFQIDVYAIDSNSCQALAFATRKALIDFSGVMGSTNVQQIDLDSEFIVTDSDPGIIRMVQLYSVAYQEVLT